MLVALATPAALHAKGHSTRWLACTQLRLWKLAPLCLQAKGPTVARHKVATLYKNEDIFMQIDSHSKLAQDWDDKAVAMLKR